MKGWDVGIISSYLRTESFTLPKLPDTKRLKPKCMGVEDEEEEDGLNNVLTRWNWRVREIREENKIVVFSFK